jgi:oxalate---CoA ligase
MRFSAPEDVVATVSFDSAPGALQGGPPNDITVGELIHRRATQSPHAVAIAAPGRKSLTYEGLADQVQDVQRVLRASGFGPESRIGLVLPTGPEMAVAFLACAAASICAPLHSSYRREEYEAYLSDLRVDAMLLSPVTASTAGAAAATLGIPVLAFTPCPEAGAGSLTVAPVPGNHRSVDPSEIPTADDVAVVMSTSGTTARPKLVPLTHRNLFASARFTNDALALTRDDRCLNVAPLFHIHGLCIVLASMLAGASAVCPPTFDARSFFLCLDECRPTWYVAGPTVHREVLAATELPAHADIIARRPLRFIRSGSAPLAPATLQRLEQVFRAPVIEAYGLTESAPIVSCNPLPPGTRKPGSVGLPAGPEVAILDPGGNRLPAGREGEIVVRGPNIMAGYEHDEPANEAAFIGGWFRTGDVGYVDDDGYLFITGREKEFINRGGQKISPYEIEGVLLRHPDVQEAASFALPHPTLGEDVAAAVVLQTGAVTTEHELRLHAAAHLAGFKVPRTIATLDTLPLGPTGKVQRVGLAERLGLSYGVGRRSQYVAPRSATEHRLARIWGTVLGLEHVGITDDFYALGGDSLQAARMLDEASKVRGGPIPLTTFFNEPEPTIERLAQVLDRSDFGEQKAASHLVVLRQSGTKRPFFYLAGDNSYYLALSRLLDQDRPFYVLEPHKTSDLLRPLTIEGMAQDHLRSLQRVQPRGPYLLGGYSTGGFVAYEMARLLRTQGHQVELLVLVDVVARNAPFVSLRSFLRLGANQEGDAHLRLRATIMTSLRCLYILMHAPTSEKRRQVGAVARRAARKVAERLPRMPAQAMDPSPDEAVEPSEWVAAYKRAITAYIPGRYDGCVTLLQADEGIARRIDPPTARWHYVAARVVTHEVPGSHDTCVRLHLEALAARIQQCLDTVP